jgi:NAD(P) transhydrogenase
MLAFNPADTNKSVEHFDFVVLGSGPAGRRGAIQAAKLGRSTLIIDNRSEVGGVSVHTGTIPSKTLRETVLNLSGWRERAFYGQSYRVKKNIVGEDLATRMAKTLRHEVDILEHQFMRNGVDHVETVHADRVLIAVGSRPYRPTEIPFDGYHVLDSDELIAAQRVPKSLTVVGAGIIGLEYATIYSALDVPVTIIEPRDTILDFIDHEIVESFLYKLRDRGVSIRLSSKVRDIVCRDGQVVCALENNRLIKSDMLLYAAGRLGATSGLGLENCGIETDHRGRIAVDPVTYLTSVPHVYAAGDVIGFPSLASTSMEQGRISACHAFGYPIGLTDQRFPLGVYCVPEISAVGLTEKEAVEQGLSTECGIARLRETSRGHIMGLDSGLLKMVFDLETRRLLGVHILGEGATELIHIGQAVINLGGTIEYFIENSFNFPTLAEAYKIAALDAWNRMEKPAHVPVPVSVA